MAVSVVVPNVVGVSAANARAMLSTAGATIVTPVDAIGDRAIMIESNWYVCGQDPAAGSTISSANPINLAVVKTMETCPGGAIEGVSFVVPSVVGVGVAKARSLLETAGAIIVTPEDAIGDRAIMIESNWLVCSQDPIAGNTTSSTKPITLTVVKTTETCPGR
ncbi:MAG: PASTA domain-containing protein [Propionibacteriaceae bacterium]|nr:PASTA domain-containing protein [Propionibacteriaceae bacterium]